MSAAREFTQRHFGALTAVKQATAAVGASVAVVRPNNPNAIQVFITNTGMNPLALGYTPDVSLTNGLLLLNNGSSFLSRVQYDGDIVGYAIYAVSPAGTTVAITEIVQEVT